MKSQTSLWLQFSGVQKDVVFLKRRYIVVLSQQRDVAYAVVNERGASLAGSRLVAF